MLQRYDWISTEKQYFGQPNTAYDFNATDPKEASRRLSKLQETKDKLSKNVNMRAMNMLGKAEEKVCVIFLISNQSRVGALLFSIFAVMTPKCIILREDLNAANISVW